MVRLLVQHKHTKVACWTAMPAIGKASVLFYTAVVAGLLAESTIIVHHIFLPKLICSKNVFPCILFRSPHKFSKQNSKEPQEHLAGLVCRIATDQGVVFFNMLHDFVMQCFYHPGENLSATSG